MTSETREGTEGDTRAGAGPMWESSAILAVVGGWIVAGACFGLGVRDRDATVVLPFALAWWVPVVGIIRSDLADYIIPDGATAAVAVLGLGYAVATTLTSGLGAEGAAFAAAAALTFGLGALCLFWSVSALFSRFGRRDALGFGDVKLAGASAIWLTSDAAALALEIAALGAIVALLVLRRRDGWRDAAMPFGAFLAPAAWLVFVAPMARTVLSW